MRIFGLVGALCVSLTLVGCDSAEDRAEGYYQNGLALIEAGDADRAILEFRNTFQLNPRHLEARRTLATLYRDMGNADQAYSQFLRLAEQYPNDLEARIQLGQMAFKARRWDELTRHTAKAVELAPERVEVRILSLAMDYRDVIQSGDTNVQALADRARALYADTPDDPILREILVDAYSRDGNYTAVLAELDRALELTPDDRSLYVQRLSTLSRMGDTPGVEAQLRTMVSRFPTDDGIKATLIRFYMSRDQADKAEAFLREVADVTAEPPTNFLALVQFLVQQKKLDAARVEIERGINEAASPALFRAIRAELDFRTGARDKAVAELEDVVTNAEPSEETRNLKVTLARMYLTIGNEVGARRLVEEILAEQANQVDALKMQAAWLTEADDTDAAISALRLAQDTDPEDAEVRTLLSAAYSRAGNHDLALDALAQAAEVSGSAPQETLRYAARLNRDGRHRPAETALITALRLDPRNEGLLIALGETYLAMEDAPRARQVIATLRKIDTETGSERARQAANGFEAALLSQESGSTEALSFLEGLVESQDASLAAKLSVLRAQVASGETGKALEFVEDLTRENPDNVQLRFARAAVRAAGGDLAGAETDYRALLTEDPSRNLVWLQLIRVIQAQGKPEEARAALAEGLAALPNDPNLLWAKATNHERAGEIDDAIEIYENLYAQRSDSILLANNLASLLSTYREDETSLERAYAIGRRLKGTDVPALQDTYGWIAHRRGESQEALPYLESAANVLATDPIVQYHLGKVYDALDRPADALRQMQRVIEIAGPADSRRQIEDARAMIPTLQEQAAAAAAQSDN